MKSHCIIGKRVLFILFLTFCFNVVGAVKSTVKKKKNHLIAKGHKEKKQTSVTQSPLELWYKSAALMGDTKAQFNLAKCYYDGKGVSQDLNKALYWFKLSAEQGDTSAKTMVRKIYQQMGDKVPNKDLDSLLLVINKVSLKELDNNKTINALETLALQFELTNYSKLDMPSVQVSLEEITDKGLVFIASSIQSLSSESSKSVIWPIRAPKDLETGVSVFKLMASTKLGRLYSDTIQIEVPTHRFPKPDLVFKNVTFTGKIKTLPQRGDIIVCNFTIENNGEEEAKDVRLHFLLPRNVYNVDDLHYYVGNLKPKASKLVTFPFVVSHRYTAAQLDLTINAEDGEDKDSEEQAFKCVLTPSMSIKETQMIRADSRDSIPEVDVDIPISKYEKPNTYALIIGNENYKTFSFSEKDSLPSNVSYAKQDARIFSLYVEKTLGVPKQNILLLTDADAFSMRKSVLDFVANIKDTKGESELIFYYAGHGYSSKKTPLSYLIPTDVSSKDVQRGLSISELCSTLALYPSKKVTIFLDACFSLSNDKLKIESDDKPAYNILGFGNQEIKRGNIVVFCASNSEDGAWSFDEQKHGLFTYCLLEQLKYSQGNLSYEDLFIKLKESVERSSTKIQKAQMPSVLYSSQVKDVWKTWKLNDSN